MSLPIRRTPEYRALMALTETARLPLLLTALAQVVSDRVETMPLHDGYSWRLAKASADLDEIAARLDTRRRLPA